MMGVGGHLAAYRYAFSHPVRLINDAFEQAQHPGMKGLVEVGDFLVVPIDRDRVLDQVIRPDRNEINMSDDQVRYQRGGRNFDHRSHLKVGIEAHSLFLQLSFGDFKEPKRLFQLSNPADHRKHDVRFSERGSTKNRPHLRQEYILVLQAKTNRSETENRVFFHQVEAADDLVPSEVKGSNRNASRSDPLKHFLVDPELLLFAGRAERSMKKNSVLKSPIPSPALRLRKGQFAEGLDIGLNENPFPILGRASKLAPLSSASCSR